MRIAALALCGLALTMVTTPAALAADDPRLNGIERMWGNQDSIARISSVEDGTGKPMRCVAAHEILEPAGDPRLDTFEIGLELAPGKSAPDLRDGKIFFRYRFADRATGRAVRTERPLLYLGRGKTTADWRILAPDSEGAVRVEQKIDVVVAEHLADRLDYDLARGASKLVVTFPDLRIDRVAMIERDTNPYLALWIADCFCAIGEDHPLTLQSCADRDVSPFRRRR